MNQKIDRIKKIWNNQKLRITAFTAVALLLALVTNLAVRHCIQERVEIAQVFLDSEVMASNGSVEIAGEYVTKSLSDEQKIAVITKIANRIGLELQMQDVSRTQNEKVSEVSVSRTSRNGDTVIKFISVNTNKEGEIPVIQNYVLVRLALYDSIDSIVAYQTMIEDELEQLEITTKSSYLQFTGHYPGELTLENKNEIANEMIDDLGGRVTYANRENNFYTVYAYSNRIADYINVGKGKVNLQVAMNYDENQDETIIYLATPILNGSY